jgi:mRNA interferase RelE/StbE
VASYSLRIKPSACKELERVGQKKDRRRIVAAILALGDAPRPKGVEKLSGSSDLNRIRVGSFRVVYAIDDQALIVEVVRVGDRKDVYRRRG